MANTTTITDEKDLQEGDVATFERDVVARPKFTGPIYSVSSLKNLYWAGKPLTEITDPNNAWRFVSAERPAIAPNIGSVVKATLTTKSGRRTRGIIATRWMDSAGDLRWICAYPGGGYDFAYDSDLSDVHVLYTAEAAA